jgi:hypothetical protein
VALPKRRSSKRSLSVPNTIARYVTHRNFLRIRLSQEPLDERWTANFVACKLLITIEILVEATGVELITMLRTRKLLIL